MEQTVKRAKMGSDLTQGPIMKGLLIFAVPIVLTNLVQQLYSMVDLIVVGQFVGNTGTVGVNTGGEIADLVSPVAMGFSTAGQIFIAQLFGAGQEQRIKKTVGTLLSFMIAVSCVLAVGTILFNRQILELLNCPAEAMGQASSYMVITALGFPFIFGYNAVCGILRGMGESKKPLYFILERDLSREDYTENTLYEFNRCCPNKGINKMKAAALISQSRRWLNRRVKRLL